MADSQSSPVLVQHATPPHSLASEISVVPLSSPTPQTHREEEQYSITATMEALAQTEVPQAEPEADTPVLEAPTAEPQAEPAAEPQSDTDTTSVPQDTPAVDPPVEPTPENPPAEPSPENPPAEPTPENIQPPQAQNEPPAENPATDAPPTADAAAAAQPQDSAQTTTEDQSNNTPVVPEPPAPPEWVTWEEDLTVPTETELKELGDTELMTLSALDVAAHEKKIFREWPDPEQRPFKKVRLSWVIKGVRGTKERPNMARTMNSPCAYIDGNYWHIKFYPRGNKGTSLSAYIRCTRHKPTPDAEVPESTFAYFEGPPDANIGEGAEPKEVVKLAASPIKKEEDKANAETSGEGTGEKGTEADAVTGQPNPTASQDADVEMKDEAEARSKADKSFRVSAQLGMVIYNPAEPRTGTYMSSEHQFNQYNDDWGWTNFINPWSEIHVRQRGQHQALLRNDTIAIDAYILIFDDPTQALWWHESTEHESIWPSKKLAGYYPMGTPPLYHSPAVAGITSWLLLAPFRKVLQTVETSSWRRDSQVKPQPLLSNIQNTLHLMRHLANEQYVNVTSIIETLAGYEESYTDVKSFWEVFRRSIELEMGSNEDALSAISKIFDVGGKQLNIPSLPVKGVLDVQQALQAVTLPVEFQQATPDFLPLMLKREVFDPTKREWKLHHDRVSLNDEIELPGSKESYTLYGFVVHVGERNSGRFYSILRPNGPGTKWLAFEDGDGNKVFSYTRHHLKKYEGLEGEELKNFKSSRQTAYMAMYIKTTCLKEYLPGSLEEYKAPEWLQESAVSSEESAKQKEEAEIEIEVYHDEGIIGRNGLLDMFNMKQQYRGGKYFHSFTLPRTMTFFEVRRKIAEAMGIDDVQKLRLFIMRYGVVGQYTSAQLETPRLKRTLGDKVTSLRPLCLWCSTLKTEEEVKLFGYPEKKTVEPPPVPPVAEVSVGSDDTPTTPAPAEGEQSNEAAGLSDTVAAVPPANEGPPALESIERPSSPEAVMEDAVAMFDEPTQPEVRRQITDTTQEASAVSATETAMDDVVPTAPDMSNEAQMETAEQRTPSEGLALSIITSAEQEAPAPVEHGHLADVVMSDAESASPAGIDTPASGETAAGAATPASLPSVISATSGDAVVVETISAVQAAQVVANEQEMADANEAAITALIASDAAAMDTAEEPDSTPAAPAPPADQTQPPATEGELPPVAELIIPPPPAENLVVQEDMPPPPPPNPHPVRNVYGFLQVFNADAQDFTVHCTFFGKRDEPIKDVMRRCMGYDKEKKFQAWHRENNLDGTTVNDRISFEDISFCDGVDIVVGDVLPEEKIASLRNEGKFSNPFALSRYLRLRDRRHPSTTAKDGVDVEKSDFGSSYYHGPLCRGQPHGPNCTSITAAGHTYVGPFTMSLKSGASGKMTYQNGDTYEGEWLNDERHGTGTFIEKRTGNKYVGGFMNGKRWGKGMTYWNMADEEADMCQICYGEDIDALFFDCGHVCACVDCAKQCSVCPICRRDVKEVVKMYWA